MSAARALTNGHSPVVGPLGQQALSAGSHPAPPAIYTAPVVAEYQRAAQPGALARHRPAPGHAAPGPAGPGRPAGPLPRRQPSGPIERQSMEAARGGSPSRAPGGAQDPGVPPQSAQGLPAASGLQAQPGVSEPQRTPGPGQRQPGGRRSRARRDSRPCPGQPDAGPAGHGRASRVSPGPRRARPRRTWASRDERCPAAEHGRPGMGGSRAWAASQMPPQSYAPPSPAPPRDARSRNCQPTRTAAASSRAGPAVDAGAADHPGARPRPGQIREPHGTRGAPCAPGPVVSRPPGPAGTRRACPAPGG